MKLQQFEDNWSGYNSVGLFFDEYDIHTIDPEKVKQFLIQYHNELIDEIVKMGEEMEPDPKLGLNGEERMLHRVAITDYQKKIQSLKG